MSSLKERMSFGLRLPGWRAWAGLVLAPMAWGFHHQLGSNYSFAACDRGPDVLSLLAGAVALVLIVVSGWLGWKAWRSAGGVAAEEADALEVFIPLLSVMAATLFGLTVLVQMLADIILPSCFG